MHLMSVSTEVDQSAEDACCMQGSRYKVHNTLDENDTKNYRANVAEIWEAGETFDPKTERLFRYLQVRITLPSARPSKWRTDTHARIV